MNHMTLNDYQTLARRTQRADLDDYERLLHALFGIGSECGEILGIYQKVFQGHEIDEDKVIDEMGDLMWFLAELADCLNVELDFVGRHNIEKLFKRYPGAGFSVERSLHRDC